MEDIFLAHLSLSKDPQNHIFTLLMLCFFLSFSTGNITGSWVVNSVVTLCFIRGICSHKEMLISGNDNRDKLPQLSCLPTISWWPYIPVLSLKEIKLNVFSGGAFISHWWFTEFLSCAPSWSLSSFITSQVLIPYLLCLYSHSYFSLCL